MRMLATAGGSVPGDDRIVPAEVQTDFDQMDILPDFEVKGVRGDIPSRENDERICSRAEVHVVVLELPGDAVGEGELDAGTEHPAPSPMLLFDAESAGPDTIERNEVRARDPQHITMENKER